MKVKAEEVTTRVDTLLEELRAARNEASAARAKAATYKALSIASKAFFVGNSKKIRSKFLSVYYTAGISFCSRYLINHLLFHYF